MRLPKHYIIALILSTFLIQFAAVGINPPLVEVMENGLQIIVKENHTAPVADIRVYVKTGSIYEDTYLGTGISHVFEHLINGGTTTTYSEKEISELIDRLGGANNAYTTKDHTCYFVTTSSDMINPAIDLLSDWMMNSSFPKNEYKRELGVVLEELHKGNEEPRRITYQLLSEIMFQVHPVRLPVIGEEALINSITHQDIINYYKARYVANNMIVVAVGDFDRQDVISHIKSAFQDCKRGPVPAISLTEEPGQLGKRTRTRYKKGLGEAYFSIGYHTVPIDHEDLYPLDVLSYILSRGGSSRLIRSLLEEKRLVSSI